ncbi:MAG: LysR family transcriptional regulator [Deltaproteobacteria bacterium]|nr:LysR family transcriptional regulator [Deltaproteobacteria bacterium]
MQLRFLEIFQEVVERESFSRAAESLGLTQPTISVHIKALEEDLSMRLLDRLGRRVTPTKAGEILYSYATKIDRLKKDAVAALDDFSGLVRGSLVIGASTIPGEYILPAHITAYKKEFPDVIPRIKVGDSDDISELVRSGVVELGVVGQVEESDDLSSTVFASDDLILVASKSFKGSEVTLKELSTLPLVMREIGSGQRASMNKAFAAKGFEMGSFNLVAEMGSTQALCEAVRAGMGSAFTSRLAVVNDLKRGVLKEVKVKGFSVKRRFSIITSKKRETSPIARAFINFIASKPNL